MSSPNAKSGSAMQSFVKWLQLKIYQVEVTFSVYIFTPYEKFIFCTSFGVYSGPFFFPSLSASSYPIQCHPTC